jgi:transglutaminase-like putative cysteine protease
MAHLKPLRHATGRRWSHHLAITPEPAQQSRPSTCIGNTRAFFNAAERARRAGRRGPQRGVAPPLAMPGAATSLGCRCASSSATTRAPVWDAATEFSYASPYVPRHDDFAAYARASFCGRPAADEAARDLMERIHGTSPTSPTAPKSTPRAGGAGAAPRRLPGLRPHHAGLPACHGPARALRQRLPADRAPPGQPRLVGSDASHAWVSVYVPGRAAAAGGMTWTPPTTARPARTT